MTTRRNFLKFVSLFGVAALPALPKVTAAEDAALRGYRYLENIPSISGSGEPIAFFYEGDDVFIAVDGEWQNFNSYTA